MSDVGMRTDAAPQMIDANEVLVAIPTLNEARHIARTIRALLSDEKDMAQVKIVVADGGSSDATRTIVEDLARYHENVHLIDNPKRLQAAAVNRVVTECAEPNHRTLVRIDAHAHYPKGYVLNVARSLRARDVAALATVMDSVGETCFQRGAAWALGTKLGSGGSGHRGGTKSGYVEHGHHAGFDLEIWRAVGGYDEAFMANEDAELDYRLTLAGGRIWLDAKIRLGYIMRPGLMSLGLQYWRYGIGRAQTVQRHGMRLRARQRIPVLVTLFVAAAFACAPVFPAALLLPAAYAALVGSLSVVLMVSNRSICALWAAPALAAMHLSWGSGYLAQTLWLRRRNR